MQEIFLKEYNHVIQNLVFFNYAFNLLPHCGCIENLNF